MMKIVHASPNAAPSRWARLSRILFSWGGKTAETELITWLYNRWTTAISLCKWIKVSLTVTRRFVSRPLFVSSQENSKTKVVKSNRGDDHDQTDPLTETSFYISPKKTKEKVGGADSFFFLWEQNPDLFLRFLMLTKCSKINQSISSPFANEFQVLQSHCDVNEMLIINGILY